MIRKFKLNPRYPHHRSEGTHPHRAEARMSRFATAAKVAKHKAEHPEQYCDVKGCLWRVLHVDGRTTPCKKHPYCPTPGCTQRTDGQFCPQHHKCGRYLNDRRDYACDDCVEVTK